MSGKSLIAQIEVSLQFLTMLHNRFLKDLDNLHG
jgi:hypothetical protein